MSSATATAFAVVLYEGPGAAALEPARRTELVLALLEAGHRVSCVRQGSTADAGPDAALLVLGCFTQPPADQPDQPVRLLELADHATSEICAQVNALRTELAGARRSWKPWFPVIDYQRCTNCMQCLSFCLFDVYGVDAQNRIAVQHHDNCKTDCPACSRVCPEVAIMFPKYAAGPINGDVVTDQAVQRQSMKVDISALLGGDIYSALRQRSEAAKERFSRERDESKALRERQRCLTKLKQALDIPDEVLQSLPSMEMIQAKAARFRAQVQGDGAAAPHAGGHSDA